MESYVEGYASENAILRKKLQSKTEAVLVLSKDLNKCRNEKDQLKFLVEELQNRIGSIKRSIQNKDLYRSSLYYGDDEDELRPGFTVAEMLRDAQKRNKALRVELDEMKQQLCEAYEDMEALRSNYARHRCGSSCNWEGQLFPNHPREELIQQLETMDTKCTQLQINLQALVDEREELVLERDTYIYKVHRLNYELANALKARKNIDIDALITENRYLHERLLQTQEELEATQRSLQKYKAACDQKNKNVLSQGKTVFPLSSSSRFIGQGQVRELLEAVSHSKKFNNPAFVENMRNVCQALFDSLEDKSLRLAHQKRANRILAKRIIDLESQAGERGLPAFPSQDLLAGYSPCSEQDRAEIDKIFQEEKFQAASNKVIPIKKCVSKDIQKSGSSDLEECQPLPPSVQILVQQALDELRQATAQEENDSRKVHRQLI